MPTRIQTSNPTPIPVLIPTRRKRRPIGSIIRLILLGIFALLFVIPVISTAVKSFSFEGRIGLKQYWELFVTNFTYFDFFWNSVIYAAAITVVCIAISLPLGFLFAKVNFKGRDSLFFVFILVMMLPFQATLLPNYIQLRDFKMLNTPLALTVPMMFSPFAVFLLRQFMKTIPNDLIEFTLLETSSVVKTFRYAILPQIKPAIVSLAILIFCESWNMVDQALIFSMENDKIMPLSVILSEIPENVKYAGGTVYMFPIIMLFVMFRETLEESMEAYKL
jgi:multiple sugar transport system permease protein